MRRLILSICTLFVLAGQASAQTTAADLARTGMAPALADQVVNIPNQLPDGSATEPSIGFGSDPENGMYLAAPNQVGISTAGGQRARFDGNGMAVTGELSISGVTGTGKAICVKSDGRLGVCSDAVGGSGTCTCG